MLKAILTGHSRGLGAALAETLLARNIPLLALARQGNPELAARHGSHLSQVSLDLADSAALAAWLDGAALAAFLADADGLLLINNAGTVQPMGPAGTQGALDIARAVSLNVSAPLALTDAVAARHRGELRVLHIASGAGRNAYAGWSIYGATKAALDLHARAVTLDAIPNLRICSMAPGVLDTDMQGEIRATTAATFPLRSRFVQLKETQQLVSPAAAATRLIDYLTGPDFGSEPVADLRDL